MYKESSELVLKDTINPLDLESMSDDTANASVPFKLGTFKAIKNIWALRTPFVEKCSFGVPIVENLDAIAVLLSGLKVMEMGGGSGIFTSELLKRGIDITMWDLEEPTYNFTLSFVDQVMVIDDLHKDIVNHNPDVILLIWPDYDTSYGLEVAKAALDTNATILYLGEGYGGCTGDDDFHELLATDFIGGRCESLEDTYDAWFGIHDVWHMYTTKGANSSMLNIEQDLPHTDILKLDQLCEACKLI